MKYTKENLHKHKIIFNGDNDLGQKILNKLVELGFKEIKSWINDRHFTIGFIERGVLTSSKRDDDDGFKVIKGQDFLDSFEDKPTHKFKEGDKVRVITPPIDRLNTTINTTSCPIGTIEVLNCCSLEGFYPDNCKKLVPYYTIGGMYSVPEYMLELFEDTPKPNYDEDSIDLSKHWCVKNDGSQRFKDLVLPILNKDINVDKFTGLVDNVYYGITSSGAPKVTTDSREFNNNVLTLDIIERLTSKPEPMEEIVGKYIANPNFQHKMFPPYVEPTTFKIFKKSSYKPKELKLRSLSKLNINN